MDLQIPEQFIIYNVSNNHPINSIFPMGKHGIFLPTGPVMDPWVFKWTFLLPLQL